MDEHENQSVSGGIQQSNSEQEIAVTISTETPATTPQTVNPGKVPLQSTEDGDHPQGDEIRRQFQHWFSDENLKSDSHLLTLCGGSANYPVSLNNMMSWRSMRNFNHKKDRHLVVAALSRSDILEVVNNDKQIKRRVPIDDALLSSEMKVFAGRAAEPAPAHMTKGMLKPTGFEEDACVYPIKPSEHAEDVELYDKALSFSSRIEVAIQRYRARRKLHQNLALVLNSFLEFGGVICSQRQFAGSLSKEEIDDMDAATIAMFKAVHFVDSERDDPDQWVVDFEGVAKAYLSEYYPDRIQRIPGIEGMELATRVLTNFYNYILQHNVCPEHMTDILAARAVCTQANHEMPIIQRLSGALPGSFNQACSYLFGGYYEALLAKSEWQSKKEVEEIAKVDPDHAHAVLTTVLSIMGGDAFTNLGAEQLNSAEEIEAWAGKFKCTQEEKEDSWEIVRVEQPSKTHKKLFASQNLNPLGKLTFKRWLAPNTMTSDLPPKSVRNAYLRDQNAVKSDRIQLWMEQDVLEHCLVGLKLRARLRYMVIPHHENEGKEDGFWYLDSVARVFPSFHEVLLNDLEAKEVGVKWLDDREDTSTAGQSDPGNPEEVAGDDSE